MIGQAMTQNLRADDRGSVTQFSVQLIQGRPAVVPDADANTGTPANIYEDVYAYTASTQTFAQDASNWQHDHNSAIDPCKYFIRLT